MKRLTRVDFSLLLLSNVALLAALFPLTSIPAGATALIVVYLPALIGFWGHVTGYLYKLAHWFVILISVVSFLIYTQLFVIGTVDIGQLFIGLTRGIQRILSSSPPIITPRWPYVPIAMISWCTGALVGQTVLRRKIWFGVGITALAFVFSYALVIGGLQQPREAFSVVAILVVLLLLSLLLVRDSETTSSNSAESSLKNRSRRSFFVVGGYFFFAVVIAVASVGVMPGMKGEVVRPRLQTEVISKNATSPLLLVRQLRKGVGLGGENSVVMRISENTRFINLASMRGYTGRTWSSATRFKPTNGRVTVGLDDLLRGGEEEYSVSTVDLLKTGGWVPYVGRPVMFRDADVLEPQFGAKENDTTEKLVAFLYPGGTSQSIDMGFKTFSPVVVVKSTAGTSLEQQTVVSEVAVNDVRDLALRVCQTVVDRYAADNSGNRGPFTKNLVCGASPGRDTTVAEVNEVLELIGDNRAHFLVDTRDRTGGESFGLVLTLMGAPGDKEFESLRIGSPEQFATATALVLQSIGIPAAVATGFRTAGKNGQVVASDAWTWVEVPLNNGRIAIFDPTPETELNPESEVETAKEEEDLSTTTSIATTTTTPTDIFGSRQAFVQPKPKDQGLSDVASWLIIVGLVTVLLCVVRTTTNIRRRSRRSLGGPRQLMTGSWHNVLEAAYAAGFRQQASVTAAEVAVEIRQILGDSYQGLNVDEMIEGANIAVYAISEPGEDLVISFVKTARKIEKALRHRVSPIQRVLAWALPMPTKLITPVHYQAVRKKQRRLFFRVG